MLFKENHAVISVRLIKMIFYSISKVGPLVLKRRIWPRCIDCLDKILSTNLDCTFSKSKAVINYSIQTSRIIG